MARLLKAYALNTACDWAADRRARTRLLIELGGLVTKAGLPDLLDDDRATLLGGLLELVDQLRGHGVDNERPEQTKLRWRRRGLRAFDANAVAKAAKQEERDEQEVAMPSS